MNDGVLAAVGNWLFNSWTMLTSIDFPGTDISIAVILIGAFLAVFSLRLLGYVFGFSFSLSGLTGSLNSAASQRGGNNKNIKVETERKGDTH